MPYAWRESPPHPSPFPRRRAAPSVRRITNVSATLALTFGLLAFFLWPAALGSAALICGVLGWLAARDDDGPGGFFSAAGFVVGVLALFQTF